MLASSALAQTPAPAGGGGGVEADTDIGQTLCSRVVGEQIVEFVCEFYEECHKSTNESHSKCIPKGNKVCNLYSKLGTEGDVIAVTSCLPYETCCDGVCCATGQQCIEANSNDGSGNSRITFTYDYSVELDIEAVARNGWKTRRGVEIKNKPRKCAARSGSGFTNPQFADSVGFRAIQVPLLCLFIVFVIFVQTIRKSQEGIIDMIPPLVVIGTSFFLVLSQGWKMTLLATFVASATAASGADKKGWIVLFQIFFLWFYYGGSAGLMFSMPGSTLNNYFSEANSKTLTQLARSCSSYYNYYKLDNRQLSWDQDSNDDANIYTGLCTVGFQGTLVFCAYVQASMLFLMTTLTTVSYLNPGKDENETKNPAAQMEMSQ